VGTTIKDKGKVREILERACQRRDLLILATPYLRFESSFVAIQDNELHVMATMSREDALYGLRTPDLKLRFPDGLGFLEAPIQAVGLGLVEGRRTVRLALPKQIMENDQRVAYRVEKVGKVDVTLSTPRLNLFTANLMDISTTGARIHTHQDIPASELGANDKILLSIPLEGDLRIEGSAIIRHMRGRSLGVEYRPPLPMPLLDNLSRWVFLRREEERERMARRLEVSQSAATHAQVPAVGGVLLVSADPDLETLLREALAGLPTLTRVGPTGQQLKEALGAHPVITIFHVGNTGLDERRRIRTLIEIAQKKVPTLLLGTEMDGASLFELASEWKASSAMVWNPARATFLSRLVQGIIRRHRDNGEGPVAPSEPQE